MKRVIIIGATSGIGKELALHYAKEGYIVGITGRRTELLNELKELYPKNFYTAEMDVSKPECINTLTSLIIEMRYIDVLIINSGIGDINTDLTPRLELSTVDTNVLGFTRLITFGFNYFKIKQFGHIAVTSSIAGTKGLWMCPAYSASKSYITTYTQSLAQKAKHDKLNIKFTTILPGFINTNLLKGRKYPLTTTVEEAGDKIFSALKKERRIAITSSLWFFIMQVWHLVPTKIWERQLSKYKV